MKPVIIKLPDRFAFVRKSKSQPYHIATRNIHSHKPIHLTSCSFDVGYGTEWPDIAIEVSADRVCKKCANSVYGHRWYNAICGAVEFDPNKLRAGYE